ncbi:MAG TPA: hypothetical protein VGM27_22480 [Acidobacteriaceae bacterium]
MAESTLEPELYFWDLADIINMAIEELIRHNFELPGFTTLLKEAKLGRTEVNRTLYRRSWLLDPEKIGSRRCRPNIPGLRGTAALALLLRSPFPGSLRNSP